MLYYALHINGVNVQIIVVFELPPMQSRKIIVSLDYL